METPGAGPSQTEGSHPATPDFAPSHTLPNKHFFSIEYPGYVQPTSVPKAVQYLGGPGCLENAFRRGGQQARSEPLMELRLRPEDPFAHPIPGDVVPTNNILLRVRKRRRKHNEGEAVKEGDYIAEAVGVLPKTVRFRSKYSSTFIEKQVNVLFQAWRIISSDQIWRIL